MSQHPDTAKSPAQRRWRDLAIDAILYVGLDALPPVIGIALAVGMLIALPICLLLGMKPSRGTAIVALLGVCVLPALIVLAMALW